MNAAVTYKAELESIKTAISQHLPNVEWLEVKANSMPYAMGSPVSVEHLNALIVAVPEIEWADGLEECMEDDTYHLSFNFPDEDGTCPDKWIALFITEQGAISMQYMEL